MLELKIKLDNRPIIYHTCVNALETNSLIWLVGGDWYFADNHRNDYHDFNYHPKIVKECPHCDEVLTHED